MKNASRFIQSLTAAISAGLGVALLLPWVLHSDLVVEFMPSTRQMGINTPLMFILAGVALGLQQVARENRGWRLARHGVLLALSSLSTLILAEHLFDVSFGIDFVRIPTAPSAATPHPGRSAPNTCLCFMMAALSLYLAGVVDRSRPGTIALEWLRRATALGVVLVAGAALAGYLLDLAALYRFASYNTMLAPTAFGLTVLGIGLWYALPDPGALARPDVRSYTRKINVRITAILFFVAATTGIAGFTVMREGLQQGVLENILLTATSNATSLASTIDGQLWFPRTIATRPRLLDAYAAMLARPDDAAARATLESVGDSFLTAGIGHVRFENATGQLLVQRGRFEATAPKVRLDLHRPGQRAWLLWQDGYLLQSENAVLINGAMVGIVKTEERLLNFAKLVTDIQKNGASSDVLICGRQTDTGRDDAVCAPSRLYGSSERIPMYKPDGSVNLPINHALLGHAGMQRAKDLRGVAVLAAYTPIDTLGLGMVVKIDEATVFAPLRHRFSQLSGIVLIVILLASLAVHFQVRPLLLWLGREQNRNRVILANSNDAFIALDADGRITDWNAQAERTFGWSEAEVLGSHLDELIIPQQHRAAHAAGLQRFARTGEGPVVNRQIEIEALRRDGAVFPVELSVTGYREQGRYISNAFLRDISLRKAAEKSVAESEKFLRTVANNIPALIGYVDRDERYRFANDSYQSMMGVDPRTMIGRTIREVLGDVTRDAIAPYVAQVLAGQPVHFERVGHEAGRPAHFMTDYVPDLADDGSVLGFFIMVTDISERKDAELRQADSERRAEAANRAKSEFVANMSHEIRTPMNAVLGITHLLGVTDLGADQRKYLEMIRLSGTSLLNILNDVLDFSKIEAGRMEVSPVPFNLNDLLNNLATIMTVGAGDKPLELAIGIDPGVPQHLVGDVFRLQQVLTNVVGNAIKFTERGEVSLLVELAHMEPAGDRARLRFLVRDTGIGMDQEQQARLFAAFSQADASMTRRFGGTGLGLAISRQLMHLMDGEIEVRSEVGQGSAFIITLPLGVRPGAAADAQRFATPWPAAGLDAASGPLRLLVVDDNATSRDYLCKTIRSWHWHAHSVGSGAEALAHLRTVYRAGGRYDVVLADWEMPGMDGLETLRALRELAPESAMPVVVMVSAYGRGKLIGSAGSGDADAILLKPVTSSSLFDTLHEAMATRRGADGAQAGIGLGAGHAESALRPAAMRQRLQGARLLLVEDNPLNQIVARGMLEQAGATLDVADNGRQAVDMLRAAPQHYDLVLMDIQMPVLDGLGATRLIREELMLSLPVLAMTAGVMQSEHAECLAAGMDDFIAKPIDLERMLDTIGRHFHPGRVVLPSTLVAGAGAGLAAAAASASAATATATATASADQPGQPGPADVFNVERLLAMSENNPAQRAKLLALLERVGATCLDELALAHRASIEQRAADAARLLHGLRGSVGTLGAKRFAAASLELERALHAGQHELAQSLFIQVSSELTMTVAALKKLLSAGR